MKTFKRWLCRRFGTMQFNNKHFELEWDNAHGWECPFCGGPT